MTNLICFIASHVTLPRLPLIEELFASVLSQTKICPIYMSYSADKNCKPQFEQLMTEPIRERITFLYNKKKKSQFQHYSNILKQLPHKKDNYIIFSDDDDVWAPSRVETMWQVLNTIIDGEDRSFVNILFPNYFIMTPEGKTYIKESKTQESGFNPSTIEHWCSIVNITVLQNFFLNTPDWIVKHPYCDILFSLYMLTYIDNNVSKSIIVQNKPIYIFREHIHGLCTSIKQIPHTNLDSFKSNVSESALRKIIHIIGGDLNSLCSSICLNIELCIISRDTQTLDIRNYVIQTLDIEDEKKIAQVTPYVDILCPQIITWVKTMYNV